MLCAKNDNLADFTKNKYADVKDISEKIITEEYRKLMDKVYQLLWLVGIFVINLDIDFVNFL